MPGVFRLVSVSFFLCVLRARVSQGSSVLALTSRTLTLIINWVCFVCMYGNGRCWFLEKSIVFQKTINLLKVNTIDCLLVAYLFDVADSTV